MRAPSARAEFLLFKALQPVCVVRSAWRCRAMSMIDMTATFNESNEETIQVTPLPRATICDLNHIVLDGDSETVGEIREEGSATATRGGWPRTC